MKKIFMLASALVLVAMSVAVTSCKKDKDKEPENCICYYLGVQQTFPASALVGGLTCETLNADYRSVGGYCE